MEQVNLTPVFCVYLFIYLHNTLYNTRQQQVTQAGHMRQGHRVTLINTAKASIYQSINQSISLYFRQGPHRNEQ